MTLALQLRKRPWILLFAGLVVLLLHLVYLLATGAISPSLVATFFWNGLIVGLVIGLAGIGLSMVYSIMGFANFAHGDYVTAGAFAGWVVTYLVAGFGRVSVEGLFLLGIGSDVTAGMVGVNVVSTPVAVGAGFVVAAGAVAGLSRFVDSIVYRPIRGEGGISHLIASVGVALTLRYFIAFVFGRGSSGVTTGSAGTVFVVPYVGLQVTVHEVSLVVVSVLLMVGIHLLLTRTKLGKAMRAMADNPDLARVTGIPTERTIRATWMIGGGLAGGAGYLIILERGVIGFNFGWALLLLIFAAVILGGIGSIYGAMAGGLTVGLASRLAAVWIPSDLTEVVAFAVMILVLLFRPQGIFQGVKTA